MASHVSSVCKVRDKRVGEEISLRKKCSQEEKKEIKEREKRKREKKERKEREEGRSMQFFDVPTIGTHRTKK